MTIRFCIWRSMESHIMLADFTRILSHLPALRCYYVALRILRFQLNKELIHYDTFPYNTRIYNALFSLYIHPFHEFHSQTIFEDKSTPNIWNNITPYIHSYIKTTLFKGYLIIGFLLNVYI